MANVKFKYAADKGTTAPPANADSNALYLTNGRLYKGNVLIADKSPDSYAWDKITNKPITLAGYGITDGATKSELSSYLPKSGGTLTGQLFISSGNDAKIILDNTDNETNYQYISFQQNGSEYGVLGTFGDGNLKWQRKMILTESNYTSYTYSKATIDSKVSSAETNISNIVNGTTAVGTATRARYIETQMPASEDWYGNQYRVFAKWASDNYSILEWVTEGKYEVRVNQAKKLATPRTIWGQPFDGSGNVSGAMTGVTTINGGTPITSSNIRSYLPYILPIATYRVTNYNSSLHKLYIESIDYQKEDYLASLSAGSIVLITNPTGIYLEQIDRVEDSFADVINVAGGGVYPSSDSRNTILIGVVDYDSNDELVLYLGYTNY